MDFNEKVGRHPGRTAAELKVRREQIADRARKTIERSEMLVAKSKELMEAIQENRASVRQELLDAGRQLAVRKRLVSEL